MHISADDLRKLSKDILTGHGLSNAEAEIVADELVNADMKGRHSLGVVLLPWIIDQSSDRVGDIRIVHEGQCTALVDGGNNVGPVVSHFCMITGITKARTMGLAVVGAHNKHTFVDAGYPARMAVLEHMVALVFACGIGPAVAPWGSAQAVLGTNPLAIGIPSAATPFILDMATAKVARSEILLANQQGKDIPEGWALDKEGKPTTDPGEALEGSMIPFGGYKGSGLSMAIELLSGPLVRAKAGTVVPGERGMLFIVIDPSTFVDSRLFEQQVASFLAEVKDSEKADGTLEILYPGERAQRAYDRAKEEGLDMPDSTYLQIKELHRTR